MEPSIAHGESASDRARQHELRELRLRRWRLAPFFRRITTACSKSPLASVKACLQSIIGAPVFSRRSFTCAAEIFTVVLPDGCVVVSAVTRVAGGSTVREEVVGIGRVWPCGAVKRVRATLLLLHHMCAIINSMMCWCYCVPSAEVAPLG